MSSSNNQVHTDPINESVTEKIPKWNEMRQINSHSVAIYWVKTAISREKYGG